MADVLLGSNDETVYTLTTNTYGSSNGEYFYSVTANNSGNVDTLKIRMSTFNTSTQLGLKVRSSTGVLLASGVILASGGTGERSVAVTPFAVVKDQSYFISIVTNSGSPVPFQSSSTSIFSQPGSTFFSPQDPLTLPGNTLSAVRKFHMWAEGIAPSLPSISVTGEIIPGEDTEWETQNFSPAVNSGTLDGIALTGVSATGFAAPGYVDGQKIPLPGTRTLVGSNGTQSDSESVTVGVIPGYTYTVLAPGFNTGDYSVVQNAGASAGWVVIHPDTDVVGEDALLETNLEGSRRYWLGDPVSGLGYSYLVTTGADGSVTVRRSLTSVGITGSGITGRGITGVGI